MSNQAIFDALVAKISELEAANVALKSQLEYFDKNDQIGVWIKDMVAMLALNVSDPGAAKNYVQFTMNWDEGELAKLPFNQVAIIFYRPGGKSPHTKMLEAENERDELRTSVDELMAEVDNLTQAREQPTSELAVWEKKIVAKLLDVAGDTFSNHGCNDFDLGELGVTKKQAAELERRYQEFNNSPEDYDPNADHRQQMDWCLMNYFSWRLGHRS